MGTRVWQGVRMRKVRAGADPDSPKRALTLPASWDDAAAEALAALLPDGAPMLLAAGAELWIRPIAARAAELGIADPLADRLHRLLLSRRGAPTAPIWQGVATTEPGYVLNLAAFHDPLHGFDVEGFGVAVEAAVFGMALAAPRARRIGIAIADLAGLLAALGLAYDSEAARLVAANIAALLRARADAASSMFAEQSSLVSPDWRLPAPCPELPALHAAVIEARGTAAIGPHHECTTAILPPGQADALLGVETGGIAPAFSPLNAEGSLTRAARAWLIARDISAESAVAAGLLGECVFPSAGQKSAIAMHRAVAPYIQSMPPLPVPEEQPRQAGTARQALPGRSRGYTQQATIGGHRVVLRTGEYEDGRLGEIGVTLNKESAAFRGLMDAFTQSVSIGLQHGVRLDEFIHAFTNTRFGAAGTVEGDPEVVRASSVLDYVFRHLAVTYLGACDVPEPAVEELEAARKPAPQLPLDLPVAPSVRRREFRVVGGRESAA